MEKVRAEIGSKIADMDDFLTQCEEKFGTRKELLDHPILGPLTGAQWRKFHVVHGRHHLKQIQTIKKPHPSKTANGGAPVSDSAILFPEE